MPKVLIVGAGLAGAAAARELAACGREVLIAEKSAVIGGKVRNYGCKAVGRTATYKCANCGLCLTNKLWNDVENNSLIDIRLNTTLADLTGEKGNYTAALKSAGEISYVSGISDVVIATGFKKTTITDFNGFVEIEREIESPKTSRGGAEAQRTEASIITGSDIEQIMKNRGNSGLFEKAPERVAFIQCFGSRDLKENAMYCSRVCCAYSSRAAKVIKEYYPNCDVTFFYMEMQQVRSAGFSDGNYFDELKTLGVNFIKCRPIKIKDSSPALVFFDNPETGRREELAFDLVVLSDGIHATQDSARIAEICGLGQTEAGFLKYVKEANNQGVHIAGCAKGPAKIEEVYAEAIAVARCISDFRGKSGVQKP